MSSKNTNLAKRKQAKIKQRQRKIKKANNLNKVINQQPVDMTPNMDMNYLVEKAKQLSDSGVGHSPLTKEEVLKALREGVAVTIPVHGSIEVISRLEEEGKFNLTPHHDLVEELDSFVARFTEEVNLITGLIANNTTMEEISDLVIGTLISLGTATQETFTRVYEEILKPNQSILEEGVEAYLLEGETFEEITFRLHQERAIREYPKYKTAPVTEEVEEVLTIEDAEDSLFDKC